MGVPRPRDLSENDNRWIYTGKDRAQLPLGGSGAPLQLQAWSLRHQSHPIDHGAVRDAPENVLRGASLGCELGGIPEGIPVGDEDAPAACHPDGSVEPGDTENAVRIVKAMKTWGEEGGIGNPQQAC